MIDAITSFLPLGDIAIWIGGVLLVVLGFFGIRRSAKKDERRRLENEDHKRADEIRDRVERDLAGRVREYDDAGWRDGE